MIPGIEDILHGLLAGKYTEEQCIAWINTHMELAAGRDSLRDHFAAEAIGPLVRTVQKEGKTGPDAYDGDFAWVSRRAYLLADAMLAARAAKETP